MKITSAALLVPILLLVKQDHSAAQEEEHSIRGLKAPPAPAPYTVTFDQALTNPDVYWGYGNGGDSWTVGISSTKNVNGRKLKIGLRGHKRYQGEYPQFNLHGDYIFNVGTGFKQDGTTPTGLPEWNFDYEFDSDVECPATTAASNTCTPLATYAYEVAMDVDPTIKTKWIKYDPINQDCYDHGLGNTATVNGNATTKVELDCNVPASAGIYQAAINGGTWHVAQNSFNYGFIVNFAPDHWGGFVANNPLVYTEGIYDVVLSIKNKKTGKVLVKTSIRFLVKNDSKCDPTVGTHTRDKCFPTAAADCNKSNIGKFNMFFTSKDTKACEDFVAGIKQ